MKKVLIIVFSNLKFDARLLRQVTWVSKNYKTTVVCFDSDDIEGVELIRIQQTPLTTLRKLLMAICLLLRNYRQAYKLFHDYGFLVERLGKEAFDLVIANDIDTLPLAFAISPQGHILFDAHEYAPRHFENNKTWKFFFQPFYVSLCKQYIPRVNAMLTVSAGLANEYEKEFGVKPHVITNAARYHELESVDIAGEKIRLIHHGIANKSRQLELMIEMMAHLDQRFTLDMILMTSDYASPQTRAYIDALKASVNNNPRIKIMPGVKSSQVVETIHQYDMGVFLIPPINFNYANTLPNKLFDFIQARLAVAIGPTPEMATIVRDYKIGVVAPDFEPKSLAKMMNGLTADQVNAFKKNTTMAAKAMNAENNEKKLNTILGNILSS